MQRDPRGPLPSGDDVRDSQFVEPRRPFRSWPVPPRGVRRCRRAGDPELPAGASAHPGPERILPLQLPCDRPRRWAHPAGCPLLGGSGDSGAPGRGHRLLHSPHVPGPRGDVAAVRSPSAGAATLEPGVCAGWAQWHNDEAHGVSAAQAYGLLERAPGAGDGLDHLGPHLSDARRRVWLLEFPGHHHECLEQSGCGAQPLVDADHPSRTERGHVLFPVGLLAVSPHVEGASKPRRQPSACHSAEVLPTHAELSAGHAGVLWHFAIFGVWPLCCDPSGFHLPTVQWVLVVGAHLHHEFYPI
mmetsp:Transcript_69683/g.166334  ORF Transcript_69683/g.166334 Transcript_69683/m.166334 type:complete len:300 (+) Transcript_69683:243-1142(+)